MGLEALGNRRPRGVWSSVLGKVVGVGTYSWMRVDRRPPGTEEPYVGRQRRLGRAKEHVWTVGPWEQGP